MDINVTKCLECLNVVSWRHHALECDGCGGWQHLKCNTGVSREDYRKATETDTEIDWKCKVCKDPADSSFLSTPEAESTTIYEDGNTSKVLIIPSASVTDALITSLVAKYGQGEIYDEDCPQCARTVTLHSEGVHVGKNGVLKIYSTPDIPRCPSCFYSDPVPGEHDPFYNPEEELNESTNDNEEPVDACTPVPLPSISDESSLVEPVINEISDCTPITVTYTIVPDGTGKGKKKLVDSLGFTYNVKENGKSYTSWQCSIRRKDLYCRATVTQRGDIFTPGLRNHEHSAECRNCIYFLV